MAEKSLEERLRALPRCLQIAFAVRCARRRQPLTIRLPAEQVRGVERALSILEQAAHDLSADVGAAYAAADDARAAAAAASERADAEAAAAATRAFADAEAASMRAAAEAAAAVNDSARAVFAAAAFAATGDDVDIVADAATFANFAAAHSAAANGGDLNRLEDMSVQGIKSVDPTESGPLGRFWKDSQPGWYLAQLAKLKSILGNAATPPPDSTPPPLTALPGESPPQELVFEFCVPDDYDEAQLQEVVSKLALSADAYYRSLGGPGLTVDSIELEQPVMEVVP